MIYDGEPLPEWFTDFDDARLLRISVLEIGKVPLHIRRRARVYDVARREARMRIAKGAWAVFNIEI